MVNFGPQNLGLGRARIPRAPVSTPAGTIQKRVLVWGPTIQKWGSCMGAPIYINGVLIWGPTIQKWGSCMGPHYTEMGFLYIRSFLMHSDTGYRRIEFPVSHLLQNLD